MNPYRLTFLAVASYLALVRVDLLSEHHQITEFSERTPLNAAFIVASLLQAQPRFQSLFVRSIYAYRKHQFAALGINWAGLKSGDARHATEMRWLLILAMDVELNPGPRMIVTPNATEAVPPCRMCGETFGRTEDLMDHNKNIHKIFECPTCEESFTKFSNLTKHLGTRKHNNPGSILHACNDCGKSFKYRKNCLRHEKLHEQPTSSSNAEPEVDDSPEQMLEQPSTSATISRDKTSTPRKLKKPGKNSELDTNVIVEKPDTWRRLSRYKNAFRGTIGSYRVDEGIEKSDRDAAKYLEGLAEDVSAKVASILKNVSGLKLQFGLNIRFFKPTNVDEKCDAHFWSLSVVIQRGDDIAECVRSAFQKVLDSFEAFVKKGSGWVSENVNFCDIHFANYQPLRGGCNATLPKYIRDKKAVLNIKSDDDRCFLWCIIAARRNIRFNAERVTQYMKEKYIKKINLDGIRFPMEMSQLTKFENQNNIAINIYTYDGLILPHRLSKLVKPKEVVNLFYYQNHFCLIRDLDRFFGDQRGRQNKNYYCPKCLLPFYYQHKRDEHVTLCLNNECTVVRMAEKAHLQFENFHKMQRRSVLVYADFECNTDKVGAIPEDMPKTAAYQKHTPCGFALVEANSCCGETEFKDPIGHRGPDCVDDFLQEVVQIGLAHQEDLDNAKPLNMSMQEETQFQQATHCYLCKKEFLNDGEKVRDHCHRCGSYRGALHVDCNLKLRTDRNITVVFHNLRKYDGHLLMQRIGSACQKFGMEVDCTAKGMEDYLSCSLRMKGDSEEGTKSWKIDFIDSLQFMSASLDNLAKALNDDQFVALRKICNEDAELFALLRRKGVYPYDYMDSWDRFDETRLPDRESFYSILTKSDISEEDYEHAKKVWTKFKMRNMGDYHNLYLMTDTLVLADVFEAFRKLCLEQYGLDPLHYITLPSLGWDACLKITGVKLDLLQDPNMYMLCEQGIRGGISVISHRYAEANNPLCPDSHDPAKPNTYILYLDANNLYGWAMSQPLPMSDFKWMTADVGNRPIRSC